MNKIPSLQLLCIIKFPIKDVLKDRNELVKLLSYPTNIVADILQKMTIVRDTTNEIFYAINSERKFYVVAKKKDWIIDDDDDDADEDAADDEDAGPEYIISNTFEEARELICSRCFQECKYHEEPKIYPVLPDFAESYKFSCKKCYYCTLRVCYKRRDCIERIRKSDGLVMDILEKKLNKSPLGKSFISIKELNGVLLYIFDKKFTQKLTKLCLQYP